MKHCTLIALLLVVFMGTAQDRQPYQIYTKAGKKTTYKKMLAAAEGTQLVLFGEQHDNAIVHWLQLELTKDVAGAKAVVLGAEMLEADNQTQLDHYLAGQITQKAFDTLARLWPNYKTDYAPLVDFAKEKHLPFIATNIPRRYASMVYKQGLESLNSLTDKEKAWIAPLPIAYDASLPGYKAMLEMAGGHGGDNLPKAQAVKDATMAHFILANLKANSVFIHYNGSYHSDSFEGIGWYVKQQNPELKIVTIATVTQANIDALETENTNKADFILVVDEDMTKTFK